MKVTTGGWGFGNSKEHLDRKVNDLLARSAGWLMYNLHGLDEESWRPIRRRLMGRLVEIDSVGIAPTARVMIQGRYGSKARAAGH